MPGEPETKSPGPAAVATDAEIEAAAVRVEAGPVEPGGCVCGQFMDGHAFESRMGASFRLLKRKFPPKPIARPTKNRQMAAHLGGPRYTEKAHGTGIS